MPVTPALKALIAERAAAEARDEEQRKIAAAPDWRTNSLMEMIDASDLDASWNGNGWRPTELLKLRYLIAATRNERVAALRAEKIVLQTLEKSDRSQGGLS